jgi:hypothetical protein
MVAILVSIFAFAILATRSEAIPAWSRKYSVDCSACHYPNPPRLNTYGHEFRRAGYRAPDEFNKEVSIDKVGEFISLRMRPRFVISRKDVPDAKTRTDFQLNDITFFYAGPMATHWSAFAEIEFEDEEETALLAQVSGIWGKPESFWTIRTGQAHTLSRVGFGGFDRPTGISTTAAQAADLTDGAVPFRINRDQRFFEVTAVRGWNRIIFQVLNGVDVNGIGNHGRAFDADNDKDLSVVYERILDDKASGFTAYSYFGRWHDGVIPDTYKFYRFGFTANKIFGAGFELQGGYIRSKDDVPQSVEPDIDGNVFFLDVEKYMAKQNFTIFGRLDWIDGNTDKDNNLRRQYILGLTKDVVSNVRLAAEAAWINNQAVDTTDFQLTTEIMVNF